MLAFKDAMTISVLLGPMATEDKREEKSIEAGDEGKEAKGRTQSIGD